ncbi:MAG: 30S ribosomal protein S13 [Patescibacteria group bacterium]|nr:30S ribosomal protein S13 [Patescibacteria group bacterium]
MRIAGVNLPTEKRVETALTYIYGIGQAKARAILQETGVAPDVRVKDITPADEGKLRDKIEKGLIVEGDLRREVQMNVKRLKEIGSYRGNRHARNLPARGQRTKTNARTKRGKRVTMGSGRKKAADKT